MERFELAKDCGFERIECPTTRDQGDAEKIKAASEKTRPADRFRHEYGPLGISVFLGRPSRGVKEPGRCRVSIRNAHLWEATTVLLVPAVVNAQTTYKEAYERSQPVIRKLIPLAEEMNITLCLEEVWNKFLLSPLEFARYFDEYNCASAGLL